MAWAMMRVVRLCSCLLTVVITLGVSLHSPLPITGLPPHIATSSSIPPSFTQESASVQPVRLVIPAIKLDAFIESVGVLADGDLETPTGKPWEDVGWYSSGPLPGQRGSAVIDGHLDRPGGYPAVFWHLRELQLGDSVIVTDTMGRTMHFHVKQVALYPPQDAPLQAIFGNDGGTYLNLITCAGDWIPSQHQTTLRLVVYTSLV